MSDRQYIAYYRVSTKKQGKDGYGLGAQENSVAYYLKAHGGSLIGEYKEIESGRKTNRPELQAALKECRRRKATLIIAKLDRLSRNVHFISGLMESRVDFVSCDHPQANKTMVQMLAVFAEWERDRISQRTKEGLAEAKAEGVELGKNGKNVLAPRNRAAADAFALSMIEIIDDLRAAGHTTVRSLTEALNVAQVPTAKEGGRWHTRSVQRLLKRLERIREATSSPLPA